MDIKELCKQYGINPSKAKGQNFLIDDNIVTKISAAAELSKRDVVLEVGPGLGVLTEKLLASAGKVIAVELDRKIIPWLRHKFKAEIQELYKGDYY
jgi:16S rRNA (adenine1518-N6/adenine1519-N6)-dimethyltransferase